jgi:hypothetical protein
MSNQYTVEMFDASLAYGAYTPMGGYPKYFITSDGETLSFDAARKNARLIREAIADNSDCGWRVVACDINWESLLYCCHTNKQIESAYDPIAE